MSELKRMTPADIRAAVEQWCAIMTATVGAKQVKVYGFDPGTLYHKVWWMDAVAYERHLYGDSDLRSRQTKSIVAFVRKSDGVVFRADSWKKRGREIGDIRDILVQADEGTLRVTGGKL